MHYKLLKYTLLLCLFSVSILRGQTPQPKAANKSANKAAMPKKVAAAMLPVMTFDKKYHDFGTIKTGDAPTLTFNFTNTGTGNLDIEQVTHCDCTDVDWTRTTVAPGEKGFISMKFNSSKAEPEEHKVKLNKFLDIILKQVNPKNGYVLSESLKYDVFIAD